MAGTFKKGKSKKRAATEILERIVHQSPDEIRLAWLAQIHKAKTGDTTAMALIVNYLDGKPHQSIDMEMEVTTDDTQTTSNEELIRALRDRMAGILPKRAVSSVASGGEEGTGGEKKPH